MGKNLRQQRRGKGSTAYRTPRHKYAGKPQYSGSGKYRVVDIIHAPGRKTPLAVAEYNGKKNYMIPPEGINAGSDISVEELGKIPEGSKIFNIELHPGDGGRLCRSSGSFGILAGREPGRCIVLMPSKQKKKFSEKCRAVMGMAAGSGRIEKPFMKAGTKFYAMQARGKYWPRTSGVSMNAVNHPFGGSTSIGKQKTISRHMPPGKKVGSISPRRSGKKK